jgi:hypothetical protein
MPAVRVMQVTADHVIGMVAVRDRIVPAIRTMPMGGSVGSAVVPLRAGVGVRGVDGDRVLFATVTVNVMKVTVVQIVAMTFMLNRPVATAFLVPVLVTFVNAMRAHAFLLRRCCQGIRCATREASNLLRRSVQWVRRGAVLCDRYCGAHERSEKTGVCRGWYRPRQRRGLRASLC